MSPSIPVRPFRAHLALLALAGSVAVGAPGAPGAARASAPAPSARAAQEELDRDEFMTRFRKAMELGSRSDMANLARRNPGTMVVVVIETCEAIARQTDERLEREIAAMQDAWKEAFDSRFATNMYEYLALMRVQVRAFRSQRKEDFLEYQREYDAAAASKNAAALDLACENFTALAEAFAQAGDGYYVSECWYRVGQGYDETFRGNKADLVKAGQAFKKSYEARAGIDLKDRWYSQAKMRADQLLGALERESKQSEEAASEGFARTKPGVALGEEVPSAMTFELVRDIEEVLRPGYENVDLPVLWRSLSFQRPGSSTEFASFTSGPIVLRTGSGAVVDQDRDGIGDVEVPVTGNVETVEITLGSGDALRKWGFSAAVLSQSEIYQGIGIPLQAQESFMALYYCPAASVRGTVGTTPIRVFDDNVDGIYGSQPLSWGFVGLTPGQGQPTFDTILVGDGKRAVPWSEYIQLGEQWYQLLSDKSGAQVVASLARLETGTLRVKAKGATPLYLVVRGSGTFEYSFFDVMAGGSKGVEVPVGSYSLVVGEVRKGKRTQMQKALILPGKSTPWVVTAGQVTDIVLGEPYDIDFTAKDGEGGDVTVQGGSLAVLGSAGERYERLWNCVLQPEVFVRKVGTKKGGRGSDMTLVLDSEEITRVGFQAAWFPRDHVVDKRSDDEQVELQLVEKKNKLFGSIESSWRPATK